MKSIKVTARCTAGELREYLEQNKADTRVLMRFILSAEKGNAVTPDDARQAWAAATRLLHMPFEEQRSYRDFLA
jgi:hypothetical protein